MDNIPTCEVVNEQNQVEWVSCAEKIFRSFEMLRCSQGPSIRALVRCWSENEHLHLSNISLRVPIPPRIECFQMPSRFLGISPYLFLCFRVNERRNSNGKRKKTLGLLVAVICLGRKYIRTVFKVNRTSCLTSGWLASFCWTEPIGSFSKLYFNTYSYRFVIWKVRILFNQSDDSGVRFRLVNESNSLRVMRNYAANP